MNKNRNMMFGMLALVVSIVAIGLAYAGFTGTLNVNGTGNVTAAKWDIYFANLANVVKTGSANVVTPATIKTKTSIGDYEVEFYTPGDSLSYTFDIVNDGSFDASISSLVKNSPTCTGSSSTSNTNVCNNLTYTLKYVSSGKDYNVGDTVSVNDTLAKGEVRRVRMLLKLNPNMPASSLPTSDVTVGGLGITIIYSQGSNYGGNPSLQEGDIAKFLPGTDFNIKIKQLANPSMSNIEKNTFDSNITSIQRSNTLSITPTADNKVSSSDSDIDIYAWFSNGTLYYYSTADKLYLNEDASHMFRSFLNMASIDFTTIDTSKTTNMQGIFIDDISLLSLDLSHFNTSNVTNMSFMFGFNATTTNTYGSPKITTLDLSNFDTSNVTNMEGMFYNCISLISLDLSNFDTSKVTTMFIMFGGGSIVRRMSLTSLNLSSFDTSNVTTMQAMFQHCSSLTTLDLSNFNTSKVTSMFGMFLNCSSLTTLDLSNFDTSSVTDMKAMFESCSSLTTLDLSSFNTSLVTNFEDMFNESTSLETIYAGNNWTTAGNTSSETTIFPTSCHLRNFSSSNTNYRDLSYANTGSTGYLTLKTN